MLQKANVNEKAGWFLDQAGISLWFGRFLKLCLVIMLVLAGVLLRDSRKAAAFVCDGISESVPQNTPQCLPSHTLDSFRQMEPLLKNIYEDSYKNSKESMAGYSLVMNQSKNIHRSGSSNSRKGERRITTYLRPGHHPKNGLQKDGMKSSVPKMNAIYMQAHAPNTFERAEREPFLIPQNTRPS